MTSIRLSLKLLDNMANNRIALSASGVFLAMVLAQKNDVPTGKAISLLTDWINLGRGEDEENKPSYE